MEQKFKYISVEAQHTEFHLVNAIAVYVRDHSSQINAQNLKVQVKAEKKNVQLLENLQSTISHEIRTPVATSIQFLDLCFKMIQSKLQSNDEHPKLLYFISMVKFQLAFILTFIHDIMDVKSIEQGKFQPEIVEFSL